MKTIEELKCSIVDINYVLENMIRENGLYCLLGEAKVGKSAMALQIANSGANGIPFLDTISCIKYFTKSLHFKDSYVINTFSFSFIFNDSLIILCASFFSIYSLFSIFSILIL